MEQIWKNRQKLGPDIAGEVPRATGGAPASMDGPSTSYAGGITGATGGAPDSMDGQ